VREVEAEAVGQLAYLLQRLRGIIRDLVEFYGLKSEFSASGLEYYQQFIRRRHGFCHGSGGVAAAHSPCFETKLNYLLCLVLVS